MRITWPVLLAALFGFLILAAALPIPAFAQTHTQPPVSLPEPNLEAGASLMEALAARKTTKDAFSGKPLTPQTLADLLWAAWGVNRPEDGKRTAPSSHNYQELDVYAATRDGLFRYDAQAHALIPRPGAAPALSATAPVTLYFVADFARLGDQSDEDKRFAAAANTGFISQNVYLFCAARGLVTGVKDGHKNTKLAAKLALREDQHLILYQPVGHPQDGNGG